MRLHSVTAATTAPMTLTDCEGHCSTLLLL